MYSIINNADNPSIVVASLSHYLSNDDFGGVREWFVSTPLEDDLLSRHVSDLLHEYTARANSDDTIILYLLQHGVRVQGRTYIEAMGRRSVSRLRLLLTSEDSLRYILRERFTLGGFKDDGLAKGFIVHCIQSAVTGQSFVAVTCLMEALWPLRRDEFWGLNFENLIRSLNRGRNSKIRKYIRNIQRKVLEESVCTVHDD